MRQIRTAGRVREGCWVAHAKRPLPLSAPVCFCRSVMRFYRECTDFEGMLQLSRCVCVCVSWGIYLYRQDSRLEYVFFHTSPFCHTSFFHTYVSIHFLFSYVFFCHTSSFFIRLLFSFVFMFSYVLLFSYVLILSYVFILSYAMCSCHDATNGLVPSRYTIRIGMEIIL